MTNLVIATRNAHKVDEMRSILGSGFVCRPITDFPGAPEVNEDAGTFEGNSTKKAVTLARWLASAGYLSAFIGSETFVLADDSGLEVDALNGAPGVNSARFAASDTGCPGNSPTLENNAKLLRLLKDVPAEKRIARFRCVLALTPVECSPAIAASAVCFTDPFEYQTRVFAGVCEGQIGLEPRGTGGFGYDPLFIPRGYNESFGQMSEQVKNRLSHRAHALELLRRALHGRQG